MSNQNTICPWSWLAATNYRVQAPLVGFREGQFDIYFLLHPLWLQMREKIRCSFFIFFFSFQGVEPSGRVLRCFVHLPARSLCWLARSVITLSSCKLPEKLQASHAVFHSFIYLSIYFGGSEVPCGTGGQQDAQGSSLSGHH